MNKLIDYMMAMHFVNDNQDVSVYLDVEDDELIYISDFMDEDYDIDEIEEDPDRYIYLASSYDLYDLDIYHHFIKRLEEPIYSQFVYTFNGRGKYRRFKELLYKYKLWDEFNTFEERKLQDYLEAWAKDHHILIDGLTIGTIREITMDDYEVLYPLMKEVYDYHQLHRPDYFIGPFQFTKERLDFIINNPDYYAVLYEENNKALGYMTYEMITKHDTKKCHIHEIGITQEAQGKGIGKKLFNYGEKQAELNQAKVIELDVFTFNQSAIAFYEAQDMDASKIIYEKKIGD